MTYPVFSGPQQVPSMGTVQDGRPRGRPVWQWVAGNLLVVALSCILGGSGFVSAEDESPVIGYVAAFCILGSVRAFSVPLEWFLARQYAYRSILLSHIVGLGFGLMMLTAPPTTPATGDAPVTGGMALAVFAEFMVALCGLFVAAAIVGLRIWRNAGKPAQVAAERGSLAALPAMFWFNTVLLAVVAIFMAPSMAAQEDATLSYGFFGGFLVAAFLRLPGSLAEWWLTTRKLHRLVYGAHMLAGLLTALVAVAMFVGPPTNPTADPLDPVSSTLAIYLLFSSVNTVLIVPVALPIRAWRRRRSERPAIHAQTTTSPVLPPVVAPPPVVQPVAPAPVVQVDHGWLRRPAIQPAHPLPTYPIAPVLPHTPLPPTAPTPVVTGASPPPPTPQPAAVDPMAIHRPSSEGGNAVPSEGQATKLRHEIAVAVGIVAGLASLVQGFDTGDPFRTAVLALTVGGIGLAVIYGTTVKR
ncbi:hypothetical protein AB0A95_10575 [Micromonospora sp. NPDC049230]|uniref:hypothetical protein n=1 Tax=Micromonospora sp. NPDC049230 TaxID=3155502 RepID=UPI0033D13A60